MVTQADPRAFWNNRYEGDDYLYGTAPNAFLAQHLARLAPQPCHLLLPGDGEGRNGVWCAAQGHRVTVVDASDRARDKALALAAEARVEIDYQVRDLANWAPREAAFDGVVIVFLHLPRAIRPMIHLKLLRALRPGGFVLLECFREEQLEYRSGGPDSRDRLYNLEILQEDFAELKVSLLEEPVVTLAEGPGHVGPGAVIRMIGHRPLDD